MAADSSPRSIPVIARLAAAAFATLAAPGGASAESLTVYIGTYTRGDSPSEGIYRTTLDLETGALSAPVLAAEAVNPSFLELHPAGRFLYAVNETGEGEASVSAFAIDAQTGDLEPINSRPSRGAAPCHVNLDSSGRFVMAANYGGGSTIVFPVRGDGGLGESSGFAQHEGSSVDPRRQEGPHAHSVNPSPDDRFAVVADLGLDKVLVFRLDPETGAISPHDPPFARTAPGAGPRHFAFHPNGRFGYVINEMASTVTAFSWDPERGVLTEIQTITTLPEGFEGGSSCAEVRVHPGGRFLYGSNRGHDSIAVFRIDPGTGTLAPVEHEGEGIVTPRNFNLDPTGRFCLVASQGTNEVLVFKVDPESGALEPTRHRIPVGRPVCLRFHGRVGETALFDGTSFDGWEGNQEFFRIEDGAVVAGTLERPIPRNEFLVTEDEFGDFELRFEARLTGEGRNAGVQFWSQRIPDHHEMIGYQCDIGEGGSWGTIWGWLYDESRRRRMLGEADAESMADVVRKDDWNELVVRGTGSRIRIWLNGINTVDFTEDDPTIPRRGRFGLQIHSGPPAECRYRNIRLRKL